MNLKKYSFLWDKYFLQFSYKSIRCWHVSWMDWWSVIRMFPRVGGVCFCAVRNRWLAFDSSVFRMKMASRFSLRVCFVGCLLVLRTQGRLAICLKKLTTKQIVFVIFNFHNYNNSSNNLEWNIIPLSNIMKQTSFTGT